MNRLVIDYVWEHNGNDSLIFADNFPGAFVRGKSKNETLSKFTDEIKSYLLWQKGFVFKGNISLREVGEHITSLDICDADSEVIFESEKLPLTKAEYDELKAITLKSAKCFQILYDSIPNKSITLLTKRNTFYGTVPASAAEMYEHTKNVNEYYFGQIGINAVNEPDIYFCRKKAFKTLEDQSGFYKTMFLTVHMVKNGRFVRCAAVLFGMIVFMQKQCGGGQLNYLEMKLFKTHTIFYKLKGKSNDSPFLL